MIGTPKSGAAGTVEQDTGWAGFCLHTKAIGWSQGDTDETIAQVKEQNEIGKRHCGWKGAQPPIQLRGSQTSK